MRAKRAEWIEVRVLVPVGWQELVAEVLARASCTSAVFGRPSLGSPEAPEDRTYVRTFYPAASDSPAFRAELEAALAGLAEAVGDPELSQLAPELRALPPEDYASSWRKSWKPFRVGRTCVVTHDWKKDVRPGDRLLRLEPGGAFGTGRHPTTRHCLAAIEERLRPGSRILDAGAGSGILSVAAALWGARECVGFDVDRESVRYARELAEENGVADRCTFQAGGFELLESIESAAVGVFDACVANIYADVVAAHAASIAAHLAPGGWFAFSGCSAPHRQTVLDAISAAGLLLEEERARGRWHTFVGTKPGP